MVKKKTQSKLNSKYLMVTLILSAALFATLVSILRVNSIEITRSLSGLGFFGMALLSWAIILLPGLFVWTVSGLYQAKNRVIFEPKHRRLYALVGFIFVPVWLGVSSYLAVQNIYAWESPIDYWLLALVPIGLVVFLFMYVLTFSENQKISLKDVFASFSVTAFVSLIVVCVASYFFLGLGLLFAQKVALL